MGDTRAWLEGELRRMLGFDEVEEIARFALDSYSVSQAAELKQYLEQFLGQSEEVRKLCDELSSRRSVATSLSAPKTGSTRGPHASAGEDFWGAGGSSGAATRAATAPGGGARGQEHERKSAAKGRAKGKTYKKSTTEEEDFWGGGTTGGTTSGGQSSSTKSATNRPTPAAASAPRSARNSGGNQKGSAGGGSGKLPTKTEATVASSKSSARQEQGMSSAAASAGKPRGARAKGRGGKVAAGARTPGPAKTVPSATKVPERTEKAPTWSGVTCLCMGKKHDAITNCTVCGKIACVEEGGFGCSFCGSVLPVTGREPRRSGESKRGDSEGSTVAGVEAVDPTQSAALKEALARKDRLILFDRTSASRTRVLDDQGDYFTSHNWLSREEREEGEAKEKVHRDEAAQRRGARRQVKLSIDIMGRRVIETKEPGDGQAGGEVQDENEQGERLGAAAEEMARTGGVGVDAGGAFAGVGPRNGAPKPDQDPANHRPSLENTGLRGRAKEVYDVMRANLEKQGRRRPGGNSKRGGFRVAEKSRVSLWRVQHDVDSDDVVRQNQIGGSSRGVGVGHEETDFERFGPVDELGCN